MTGSAKHFPRSKRPRYPTVQPPRSQPRPATGPCPPRDRRQSGRTCGPQGEAPRLRRVSPRARLRLHGKKATIRKSRQTASGRRIRPSHTRLRALKLDRRQRPGANDLHGLAAHAHGHGHLLHVRRLDGPRREHGLRGCRNQKMPAPEATRSGTRPRGRSNTMGSNFVSQRTGRRPATRRQETPSPAIWGLPTDPPEHLWKSVSRASLQLPAPRGIPAVRRLLGS